MKHIFFLLLFVLSIFLPAAQAGLSYTGSSTIGENIMPETGLKFDSIRNPGSGKGLEELLQGKADLCGVSRELDPAEKKLGLYYQIIGYDAIAIMVNEKNPVSNLSREQIKKIFTGKIKNWKEVGGNDAPIVCITETWGDKRATMVEFQKLVLDGLPYREDRKEVDKPRDQAEALAREPNGIISVSLAFLLPGLKTLAVDDLLPTPSHIRSGAYLISRPLLLVTKGLPSAEEKEFIFFILSPQGQKIVGKKFVPVE